MQLLSYLRSNCVQLFKEPEQYLLDWLRAVYLDADIRNFAVEVPVKVGKVNCSSIFSLYICRKHCVQLCATRFFTMTL